MTGRTLQVVLDTSGLKWADRALCAEVDAELFFSEMGGEQQAQAAKSVCRLCEVRPQCLEYALELESRPGAYGSYGIWGGMAPTERNAIRRQRREGKAAA